ncbi:MAG: hypothetical protein AB8B50_13020 [Pirellulaceae bacterium]
MSNVSIVKRIEVLVQQLENGDITCQDFAAQFSAHFPALDNMEYPNIKAAQMASMDFEIVGEFNQETFSEINTVSDVVNWVRNWLSCVPT